VTGGLLVLMPVKMGSTPIVLDTSSGATLTTATTEHRMATSVGTELRLGFRLTPRISAEVAGGWSRVTFETSVTGDTEGAASTSATLAASRFLVGGAAIVRLGPRGKRETYVLGGVSWLREAADLAAGGLYEDGTLTEAGGGMKIWLLDRAKGRVKRLGIRIEGRVGVRTGGISLDTRSTHILPVFAGSLIIGS
jgi:hypothetical protein